MKAALFEDSVAIVGLLLAFAGLLLRQLTGSEVYDATASIAIGALLVAAAIRLGADNRELLIGKAADPGAFDDDLSADGAENVADFIDARLAAQLSVIPHVFLDPTQLPADSAA